MFIPLTFIEHFQWIGTFTADNISGNIYKVYTGDDIDSPSLHPHTTTDCTISDIGGEEEAVCGMRGRMNEGVDDEMGVLTKIIKANHQTENLFLSRKT